MDYPVNGPQHVAIAAIQFNPRDDKIANIDKALSLIDQAASSGARLVVLPEIWTYMGDPDRNRENAEPIPGDLTMRLSERARRHGIYLHAGTFAELVEGDERVRNTAVVFDPEGEIIATYRKIHMFDVTLDGVASYQESATVAPGDEIVTFELDGVTFGLATCYDLRFPEIFRILTLRGAEVILLPAAFTMTTGKDHWEVLIRARAIENQVYMVAAGQYGPNSAGQVVLRADDDRRPVGHGAGHGAGHRVGDHGRGRPQPHPGDPPPDPVSRQPPAGDLPLAR